MCLIDCMLCHIYSPSHIHSKTHVLTVIATKPTRKLEESVPIASWRIIEWNTAYVYGMPASSTRQRLPLAPFKGGFAVFTDLKLLALARRFGYIRHFLTKLIMQSEKKKKTMTKEEPEKVNCSLTI